MMVERVNTWDLEEMEIHCTLSELRGLSLEPCPSCHRAVPDLPQHIAEMHSHAPPEGPYR